MQRMFNVDKWTKLTEGTQLEFANPRPRNIRLEVNAPVKSSLHVIDADGEVHFLALVEGRDTIEFGTSGKIGLTVEGSDVMIYTADSDDISQVVVAPVIFTKIVERRRRNPELEYIAAQMQANMNRRMEQQAYELEQLFTRRAAASAALAETASVPAASGSQPTATNGAGSSDPSIAPSGAGSIGDGSSPPSPS